MDLETIKAELQRLVAEAPSIAPSIQNYSRDNNYGEVTDTGLDRGRQIRWDLETKALFEELARSRNSVLADLFSEYQRQKKEAVQYHSTSVLVLKVQQLMQVALELLSSSSPLMAAPPSTAQGTQSIEAGYAFVAMPMDPDDHSLVDVLDAVKDAAARCDVRAERIDDPQSNDRITDRMLESIRRAQYVIVDLTNSRPNVYFEAGFAHGHPGDADQRGRALLASCRRP